MGRKLGSEAEEAAGTLTHGRVCHSYSFRVDFVEVVVTKGHQAEM